METINKLLILALIIAIVINGCCILWWINSNKNITITSPLHPYNECIKLLIDQANKEQVKFEQDKAKNVCFDLLNQSKM